MVVGNAQFSFRADHPERLDAPDSFFLNKDLTDVPARHGQRNLLSDSNIRCTAYHGEDIGSHTKAASLLRHDAASMKNLRIDTSDEPDHLELCRREQAYFHEAIEKDLDLREQLADVLTSLRIVLAADESIRTGAVIHLT